MSSIALAMSSASSPRRSRTRWPRRWPGTASRTRPTRATRTGPRSSPLPEATEAVARRLRRQAAYCLVDGSPLYASLLKAAADDVEAEGPVRQVLAGFENDTWSSALSLRLMGAVHRLVLDDTMPELARHYPSTGGDGDATAAWPVFRQALIDQRERIRSLLPGGCQTNEVGRSAALLGGFLEVAHRTGHPLRIVEIGASAGLNLRWDRYRYESSEGAWGDATSPVRFTHSFDVPPPMNRSADVVARMGCDLEPIDPTSTEGALILRSFIWADQLARMALLDGAIEIAAGMPVEIERVDAGGFLERELARPVRGTATVVYHSVFSQYVPAIGRQRIQAAIEGAQRTAPHGAPVHYLRMEPGQSAEARFEIRLDDELVGTSPAHGTGVRWLVDSSPQ